MDWKRERDSLIAQTYAFVQSVAGKKEDVARMEARLPPATAVQPPRQPSPEFTHVRAKAMPVEPVRAAVTAVEAPRGALPLPLPSPVIAPSEVRDEMQARIASFRAHQDRFKRERAEYFNATLAKLRAELKETPQPRSGKIIQVHETLSGSPGRGPGRSPSPVTRAL
jgi:hypothetical protein